MNPAVLSKLLTAGTGAVEKSAGKSVLRGLAKDSAGLIDKYGLSYLEDSVPVAKLMREAKYQPRTTASGAGTTRNVFEKGYNEGLVDQPMLVRKMGDQYQVLGGHSRTLGLEKRAEAGLDNPEFVKARIYDGISDLDAKKISRAANQGGQYESTLDMAKSISDSINDNLAPSVQKQNLVKGHGYDDYKYLWDTVSGDNLLKRKVEEGAISQSDVLGIARHARQKNLDPNKTMGIISSLDKNGTLTKQNAKNVINLVSGKYNAGIAREAQTGLFGDIESAVNSVDLLKNFEDVSKEMTRRVNALKVVSREEGISPSVISELETAKTNIEKKMKDIGDEVLARYNKKRSDIQTTATLDEATPAVSEDQTGLFGAMDQPTQQIDTPKPVGAVKEMESTGKSGLGDGFKVNYDGKSYTTDEFNKMIAESKKETAQAVKAPEPVKIKTPIHRESAQLSDRSKLKLDIRILDKQLPSREELRSVPTEELIKYIPGWKDLSSRIFAIQGMLNKND